MFQAERTYKHSARATANQASHGVFDYWPFVHGSSWNLPWGLESVCHQQCSVSDFSAGSLDSGARTCTALWLDRQLHTGHWLLLYTKPTPGISMVLLGWLTWTLWTAGVTLRWLTDVYLLQWRILLPLSAVL